jgi:hypothetical protein
VTGLAENMAFRVLWDLGDLYTNICELADGREEREILSLRLHLHTNSVGVYGMRLWLHESEPGATLVSGEATDDYDENLIEGCTGVEQYECIPSSKFILAKELNSEDYGLNKTINLLPILRSWKKRALAIDSNDHKSNLNLCIITHQDQSQTVGIQQYLDMTVKSYQGASRLGLKDPTKYP